MRVEKHNGMLKINFKVRFYLSKFTYMKTMNEVCFYFQNRNKMFPHACIHKIWKQYYSRKMTWFLLCKSLERGFLLNLLSMQSIPWYVPIIQKKRSSRIVIQNTLKFSSESRTTLYTDRKTAGYWVLQTMFARRFPTPHTLTEGIMK
jgi:hypothetical protein